MRRIRWRIADYLSRIACWLRGHEWKEMNCYHGPYGNLVAELKTQIWHEIVSSHTVEHHGDMLESVDDKLTKLAQLAGENWGHIK